MVGDNNQPVTATSLVISEEDTGIVNTAQYTRVINNTSGEIVNLSAASVGRLEANRLGIAAPVGSVTLDGVAPITDARFTGNFSGAYPFVDATNAIRVTNAIDIISRGVIGNIAASGDVQNLIANQDGKNDKSTFEGIAAPVLVRGNLRRVDIGEGLATSGSGDVAGAGLFAGVDIGLITNVNGNGDIRGDIEAGNFIEGIQLGGGGSIIDSDILQTDFGTIGGLFLEQIDFTLGLEDSVFLPDSIGNASPGTVFGIGNISINGNGGVINSRITGGDMGNITVSKAGFGVFTSYINGAGSSTLGGVSAGGLGIRGTTVTGGGFVGSIKATGTGKTRSITEFSKSVRLSESSDGFDSQTGVSANAANDLYLYLGVTTKKNKIPGVTDDGIIEDSILSANRGIDSVSAYDIRAVKTLGTRPQDETYPMQINFADSIGKISASNDMNGVRMVGGKVGSITSGRDMLQTFLQATSRVKTITAGRNVLGTSHFNVQGEGSVDTFQVNGFMNGTLSAAQGIRSLIVKGDVGSAGSSDSDAGIFSGDDINVVRIGGSLIRNAYIRSSGLIKQLVIDGDITKNARLRATSFSKMVIGGTTFGQVIRG